MRIAFLVRGRKNFLDVPEAEPFSVERCRAWSLLSTLSAEDLKIFGLWSPEFFRHYQTSWKGLPLSPLLK